MSTLLWMAAVVLVDTGLVALLVWIAARTFAAPRATVLRAVVVSASRLVVGIATSLPMLAVPGLGRSVLGTLLWFVLNIALQLAVIRPVLGVSWLRAWGIWGLGMFVGGILSLGLWVSFRQQVIETYASPSNSMAPTILSFHREAPCPKCGGVAVLWALHPDFGEDEPIATWGICQQCLKASEIKSASPTEHPPDRFLVNKQAVPQRWDIVLFRNPEDDVLHLRRLVGLPGEEVTIRDGAIWIDGNRQTPPPKLEGLEWVTKFDFTSQAIQGTAESPLKLGADEYGVLGDFSRFSHDSRSWGPLPSKNVQGVVGGIWWPPRRIRFWR